MTKRNARKVGMVLVVVAALIWAVGAAGSAASRGVPEEWILGMQPRLFHIPEGRLMGDLLSVALTEEDAAFTDLTITLETQGSGTYSGHLVLFDLQAFEAQAPDERSVLPQMIVAQMEFSDGEPIATLPGVSLRPSQIGMLAFAEESGGISYRLTATAGPEDPPFIPVRLADRVPIRPIVERGLGYAVQVPAPTVRDHTIIMRAVMENFAGPGGIREQLDLSTPKLTADDILAAALRAERIDEATNNRIRAVTIYIPDIARPRGEVDTWEAEMGGLRAQLAEAASLADVNAVAVGKSKQGTQGEGQHPGLAGTVVRTLKVLEDAQTSPTYAAVPGLRDRLAWAVEMLWDGALTIYSPDYAPGRLLAASWWRHAVEDVLASPYDGEMFWAAAIGSSVGGIPVFAPQHVLDWERIRLLPLPELNIRVADWFMEERRYTEAIRQFEFVLEFYPASEWAAHAWRGIVRAEVERVRHLPEHERGEIPASEGWLIRGLGHARVTVENETGYELTVAYLGPDAEIVTLATGTSATFSLAPGTYEVSATIDGPIIPFYGVLELLPDRAYIDHFYIETRPVP